MSKHNQTRFAGIYTNWVDEKNAVGAAGGPPWDEIMRAFVHYTGNFKKFPKPSIEHTVWENNCVQGDEIECDGETDIIEHGQVVVYLRDFNDDLMAEYTFDHNDRMTVKMTKKAALPAYRVAMRKKVEPSPELGKALKTLLK